MNIQFVDGAGYVACREFGEGIIDCLEEGFNGVKFALDSDDIVQSEITNKGIKRRSLGSAFSLVRPRDVKEGTYEISTEPIDKSNKV